MNTAQRHLALAFSVLALLGCHHPHGARHFDRDRVVDVTVSAWTDARPLDRCTELERYRAAEPEPQRPEVAVREVLHVLRGCSVLYADATDGPDGYFARYRAGVAPEDFGRVPTAEDPNRLDRELWARWGDGTIEARAARALTRGAE